MDKTILLDLDGVCADFVTWACRCHGITESDVPWDDCGFYMERGMGLTPDEFWAPINAEGREFWTTIPPYEWMDDLLGVVGEAAAEHGAAVHVCTSPSRIPECQAGKVDWMYAHLPKSLHRGFVFTSAKHLLARPDAVLIDDGEHNVDPFRQRGGQAVLFPARYNRNRKRLADRVGYVREQLSIILPDLHV